MYSSYSPYTSDTFSKSKPVNSLDATEPYYRFDPRRAQKVVEPDPVIQQQLYARATQKNRTTGYSDGPYMSDSQLSQLYFSQENEQILQNALREKVYRLSLTPEHIGPPFILSQQNSDYLKSEMLFAFTTHYADRIPKNMTITEQIAQLNQYVLERVVPRLYTDSCMHYRQITTYDQPIPVQKMPQPKQYDRDYKSLEYQPFL